MDGREWLSHFPERRRGPLANWFHYSVRRGANIARDVLMLVRGEARLKAASRWSDEDDRAFAAEVLRWLEEDAAGARAYAEYVLRYEALPAKERQAIKGERGAHYRTEYMRNQPPTDKQLKYLSVLGHDGEVRDRAHASELIDTLSGGRR